MTRAGHAPGADAVPDLAALLADPGVARAVLAHLRWAGLIPAETTAREADPAGRAAVDARADTADGAAGRTPPPVARSTSPSWVRLTGSPDPPSASRASARLADAGAGRTLEPEKEMRNPRTIWTDPEHAQVPLEELREGYRVYVATRSKPVSPGTVGRYLDDLRSFATSLALHDEPAVLDSLNPFTVERWLLDMRAGRVGRRGRPLSEETISARLSALKTFTRKYVYRHLELTTRDLLDKVERFDPPVRTKEGLTDQQLERVLGCYAGSDRYTDVRDAAMVLLYAASGLRFSEVLRLELDQVDRYSGWIRTIGKGDRERIVRVGERALKALRRYLRVQRAGEGVQAVFTTEEGTVFSYQGGQSVFRRLKQASGLPWLHAHRFRHTWAQTAIRKGAELALVQEAMGWQSDRMARRYEGWVRQERAATAMPALAPV